MPSGNSSARPLPSHVGEFSSELDTASVTCSQGRFAIKPHIERSSSSGPFDGGTAGSERSWTCGTRQVQWTGRDFPAYGVGDFKNIDL